MASRGMMSENNFLSKSAIVGWLNSTLWLRLERVEDTASGAVACQLMDVLHPGAVNLRRVDFNARAEYEVVANYKELQQALAKAGVDKPVAVAALAKGKRQDNNEFMQWFKGYWDSIAGGRDLAADYDAVGRRAAASKTGDWKRVSVGAGAPRPAPPAPAPAGEDAPPARRAPPSAGPPARPGRAGGAAATPGARPLSAARPAAAEGAAAARAAELADALAEAQLRAETAERERDFYFDKLRDIEILCQAPELAGAAALKTVEAVLYAADSAEAKAAMAAAAAAAPAAEAASPPPAELSPEASEEA